jgi:hypothetical protein
MIGGVAHGPARGRDFTRTDRERGKTATKKPREKRVMSGTAEPLRPPTRRATRPVYAPFARVGHGVLAWIALGSIHSHSGEHPHEADEPASTGFLPLTLAITLFVTGLFVLGFVQC